MKFSERYSINLDFVADMAWIEAALFHPETAPFRGYPSELLRKIHAYAEDRNIEARDMFLRYLAAMNDVPLTFSFRTLEVARGLVGALGFHWTDFGDAIDPLLNVLRRSDCPDDLRGIIFAALGCLDADAVIPDCMDVLCNAQSSDYVRDLAIGCLLDLARIHDRKKVPAITRALGSVEHMTLAAVTVRPQLMQLLASLGY
ncbi:MAG: hypothetical protein ABIQ99_16050 [Thermoflexales bacterium]